MPEHTTITRNQIISALSRSPHGKLHNYTDTMELAVVAEPDFTAHLIAWNDRHGKVRDSKVALPILWLAHHNAASDDLAWRQNALAAWGKLPPRDFIRAEQFAIQTRVPARERKRLVRRYLRAREQKPQWWIRSALQHRRSMKALYARYRIKPNALARSVLFDQQYPRGSVFWIVANLYDMSAREAAGHIIEHKIPFLVAVGALRDKAKEPDLVLALIERMSPTELVTNVRMFKRLGIDDNPALRAAYDEGLKRAAKSTQAVLKAGVASKVSKSQGDEKASDQLAQLQEKQLAKLSNVEGNWLVLADRSGSMQQSITLGIQIAALLTKTVKGQVHLVFFNFAPQHIDVTGKTLEEIQAVCQGIIANGGTSIGCGMQYAIDRQLEIHGIAIVSDGGENQVPVFADRWQRYRDITGCEPTIYLFRVPGDPNYFEQNCRAAGVDFQQFEASGDYYSIVNLIPTLRTNRFALADEILDTPLLTLDKVLPLQQEMIHAT